ncbi:sensor domain-containing diguanylate cyclase [Escherichia fergusonii]|nr:sensor domain-containing diguanylate cyclase [Escherichia fergusonii]EHU9785205.1 sensor domain-containing diguanylate cyclase [Escherichia fergusonii]
MSDKILARVSQSLASEQSLESLVRQLLEMLEMVTDMESTYLTKVDVDARLQHILFAHNSQQMCIPEDYSVMWDNSLCKRAIDENCFYSDEVNVRWKDCIAATTLGITTFLSTPIHLPDGSFYGTLCAASSEKKPWSERAEQVLQLFAGLIAQYIQKESLVTQLREANTALVQQSCTDALTGLPNRRAIFEHLPTLFTLAQKLGRNVLLAYIDLDNFKKINDRFGHSTGDRFLIEIGERLKAIPDKYDILGRLGDDEFLLACLAEIKNDDSLNLRQQMKMRIQQQIRGEYYLPDAAFYYPGASMGVLEVDPSITDIDSALNAADRVMYEDKKQRAKTPFVVHEALLS